MTETLFEIADVSFDALPRPERFLLQSLRAWACCCRGRCLPAEPVRHAFAALGIPTGAEALDTAMTRIVLDTRRPLALHCPPHAGVTADEARLLAAAGAAQEEDPDRARALLADLLPATSAATVADALACLGLHLAAAGLPLCEGAALVPASRPTLH